MSVVFMNHSQYSPVQETVAKRANIDDKRMYDAVDKENLCTLLHFLTRVFEKVTVHQNSSHQPAVVSITSKGREK